MPCEVVPRNFAGKFRRRADVAVNIIVIDKIYFLDER